jgi:hypothetical protein
MGVKMNAGKIIDKIKNDTKKTISVRNTFWVDEEVLAGFKKVCTANNVAQSRIVTELLKNFSSAASNYQS